MTGEWPVHSIDHRDGNKLNNRWTNLRMVTHKTNCENRVKPNRNSTSGILGVSAAKDGTYKARICSDGAITHLGTFATAEIAQSAYLEAKRRLHGGCTI